MKITTNDYNEDRVQLAKEDRSLEVTLPSGHIILIHPEYSEVYVVADPGGKAEQLYYANLHTA